MDDELVGRRIVRGGGLQRLDIGAVPGLGHGKATEDVEIDQALDVLLVVPFGAEVLDRATEETPLDAGFDHQ